MKTVRWGILGTGTVAGHFASALALVRDAELHAVASRSGDRARSFAKDFGVKRAYGAYEELVDDDRVDVVYVATPNTTHKQLVILALEHGKAVLCEKPFAMNAEEACSISDVARRSGRFCMEGMWMRFVPLMRELVTLVRRKTIGPLRLVTASVGYPCAFDATSRLFDPRLGGGVMLDLGIYALSFAFQFLGRPSGVVARAVVGASGVDEQASVLLGYPNEAQAVLSRAFVADCPTRRRSTEPTGSFASRSRSIVQKLRRSSELRRPERAVGGRTVRVSTGSSTIHSFGMSPAAFVVHALKRQSATDDLATDTRTRRWRWRDAWVRALARAQSCRSTNRWPSWRSWTRFVPSGHTEREARIRDAPRYRRMRFRS